MMDGVDAVPHGMVTFLFTDIEGSTALWESDPEAMDRALRSHDELVTASVAASGGMLFSQAGDSFAAAFALAADAVAAAVRIQQAMGLLVEPVVLRLRIGLHSGDSVDRDHNYFGPTVNRAARLMAAAHGGQIVCSSATAELATPELSDDVTLRHLGLFRLKDLLAPRRCSRSRPLGS